MMYIDGYEPSETTHGKCVNELSYFYYILFALHWKKFGTLVMETFKCLTVSNLLVSTYNIHPMLFLKVFTKARKVWWMMLTKQKVTGNDKHVQYM